MSAAAAWIAKLEAELTAELGQPVKVKAVGGSPEKPLTLGMKLELPGELLVVAANPDQLARILVEGRVIDDAQADAATVRDLWSGILGSIAEKMGGRLAEIDLPSVVPSQTCLVSLGDATMSMSVVVETEEDEAGQIVAPIRSSGANYDLLLEVELDATVRFGSREMELGQILELGPGDVVELDRHVADPVDLIVGDKIVAKGEVVLVNGNFGLRVTEVAEPVRRLESIRCLR